MRGGKRPGAGAPTKEVKRNNTVNIRFTDEELIVVDVTATALGMNRNKFIRWCVDEKISALSVSIS